MVKRIQYDQILFHDVLYQTVDLKIRDTKDVNDLRTYSMILQAPAAKEFTKVTVTTSQSNYRKWLSYGYVEGPSSWRPRKKQRVPLAPARYAEKDLKKSATFVVKLSEADQWN